jgi:hypothetical protein
MTELTVTDARNNTRTNICPPWCVMEKIGNDPHTHSSADSRVETMGTPLSVQLIQVADAEPRRLIDGQDATIEQATHFAHAIKRLTAAGTLAEPGLSFVVKLATGSGITLEEMAKASGLDVSRLRQQRAGGRVMTVAEIDQVALVVANLSAARNRS